MLVSLALGALVLLAQAPPAAGPTVRYRVTLTYHGVWGLVTEANQVCPGVPPGTDTIAGIVEGVEPALGPPPDDDTDAESSEDEGVQYAGDLTRATEVGLCEVKDTSDGTEWCAGHLSGGGPFRVTITVPPIDCDNEQARVKLEPRGAQVRATVSGSCSSLENAAVARQYKSEDSIYFETANASGTKLMPTGVLRPGTYVETSRSVPGDLTGYT